MPMAQQNARFLMSAVKKIATGRGDALKGTSVQYLCDGFETTGNLCPTVPSSALTSNSRSLYTSSADGRRAAETA
jgi:hypothetical protein